MRIFLVEPYYGGSHRAWADGYAANSSHEVHLITHEARFWKWRMEGGFVTLAEEAKRKAAAVGPPDVVLASDMLHLPAFVGAGRSAVGDAALVLYMHENQLTYPPAHQEAEDLTHSMINWASVAAADAVAFNSEFHRRAFFAAVGELLGRFPDHRHRELLEPAGDKCTVLPVGMDLARLHRVAPARDSPPLVLWNHRWEHDKNPDQFFAALGELADRGHQFRVAVVGQAFGEAPPAFASGRSQLGDRIVQWGFAPQPEYDRWLRSADVVVSTAFQEFFGVAVLEAVYAGAFPILPDRLAYPEHIPATWREACLYDDPPGLVNRLEWAIAHPEEAARVAGELTEAVGGYDWSVVAPRYDAFLADVSPGPSLPAP